MNTNSAQTTEQAILTAAEREFLTKGYDGARTTSIAEAAGVTHAMLHYYYRTKEQLFARILDEKMRLMSELVLTVLGKSDVPLLERIEEGMTRHFDFLAANPDLPRFIINELYSQPDRSKRMRLRMLRMLRTWMYDAQRELDAMVENGRIEPVDIRMLMLDILSLNIFPFIASPLIEPILGSIATDKNHFFGLCKAENRKIIMQRLK